MLITDSTTLTDIRADREARYAFDECAQIRIWRGFDNDAWRDLVWRAENGVIDAANAVIAIRTLSAQAADIGNGG
jgi:hypothetical protein